MQGSGATDSRETRRAGPAIAVASLIAALALVGAAVATSAPHRHGHGHHHPRHHRHQRPHPTLTVWPWRGSERLVHPGLFGVNHRYAYDGFGMWEASIPGVPRRFERRFDAARVKAVR